MGENETRWKLADSVRDKYKPKIEDFIKRIEREEPVEELSLSDTELNPYTLGIILEELGYSKIDQEDNGWQLDFWVTYVKDGYRDLIIQGCAMIFEMGLTIE